MNNKTNILFLWKPEDILVNYLKEGLKEFSNLDFHITDKETKPETEKEYYYKADIVIGWRPNEEYIKEAKNLKLFINPGAGVKHLMKLFKELNTDKKITLVNGHGNSYFTAQHGVALLLSLMNKIIPHHNWMKEGKWRLSDKEAASIPLRDRKVGLLGYGAINKKIHKFLSGFDVEFHILKRSWENDYTDSAKKYLPGELHEFLSIIDTLIIALPDTDETNNLIDAKELELLGKNKNTVLVNIARGAIINEEALYNALKNYVIAGAALDVWYNYSPEANAEGKKYPYDYEKFPFHEIDNVILSPHRAASPHDDLKRWDEVIENISRFAKGEQNFLNTVDIEKGY
jgi:phosphoglycerate dehydrogenase-like enzyme